MRVKWDRDEKRREEEKHLERLKKMNDGEEDEIGAKGRIAGYGGCLGGGEGEGYNPSDWSRVALTGEGNSVSL